MVRHGAEFRACFVVLMIVRGLEGALMRDASCVEIGKKFSQLSN